LFGIVPNHSIYSERQLKFNNCYSPLSHQMTDRIYRSKWSANSGRNHLMASLGIPFITSPQEDFKEEYEYYPDMFVASTEEELVETIKSILEYGSLDELGMRLNGTYRNRYSPEVTMVGFSQFLKRLKNELPGDLEIQ